MTFRNDHFHRLVCNPRVGGELRGRGLSNDPSFYINRHLSDGCTDVGPETLLRIYNGLERLEQQGKVPAGAKSAFARLVFDSNDLSGTPFIWDVLALDANGFVWDKAYSYAEIFEVQPGLDLIMTRGIQVIFAREIGVKVPSNIQGENERVEPDGTRFIKNPGS